MSRSISKIVAATLMIVFVFALFPGMKLKAATSGTCGNQGDNVKWTLDDDGTLTISGKGAMKDWSVDTSAPSPFQSNTSISKVVIENGVTTIGMGAFSRCTQLSEITIPNSVDTIGPESFSNCSALSSIIIPNSVTRIDQSAFYNCTSLTSITIPYKVSYISRSAFQGCTSLTSITIPNSVTSINSYAFHRCTSLTSIIIPNSVTSIGNDAFKDCTSLTSITIRKSLYDNCKEAFPNISSDAFHFDAEITFKNYDDTVLESKKVAVGETPSYTGKVTPTKPSSGGYSYEFAGWDPIPGAVTGPATYTAVYDKKEIKHEYEVTFKNYDDTVLESKKVFYGETPSYTGKVTPTKPSDGAYSYEFAGWTDGNTTYGLNKDLPRIVKDTTFKPVFNAEPKPVYTVGEVKGDGIKSDIVIDVHRNVDDENCLTYFLSATIDGTEMKINDQYTATKGSTIITIKKDFLSTLPAGEHEVQVVFNDGSISTKVTIAAKASVPSTGEVIGPATYIGLALIVTACVCGTGVVLLKKRKEA